MVRRQYFIPPDHPPSTIDGGTDRFAGAQGEFLVVGDYDLVAEQGRFKFKGWVSY